VTIDVVELGVADAQRRMTDGAFTARELAEAYLDRIAALDRAGPLLTSVIETSAAARDDADALDAERTRGRVRGPLHGIPVLVKDNIDVVGMVNSAGSLALAENRPQRDAFLAARLRAAGAVLLGKTNLSEWANYRSKHSTSGWSSRGGQTRNAYVLDRNPCGSSSGTATAIAASLATVGVGTETDGSIICPAAIGGLVGMKPTVGLVSRRGIIPIAISQDTAGPMGRTVADVAALLTVLVAIDDHDPASATARAHVGVDYSACLNANALAGARLGIARASLGFNPAVDAAIERGVAALQAAGAEVVDVELDKRGRWRDAEGEVLAYEFKAGLNAYLQGAGGRPGSLAELIAWNDAHRAQAMPWFGQDLFIAAQAKGPLTDAAYLEARATARRLAGAEGLFAVLDAHRLDALIGPANGPAWLTDPLVGHQFAGGGASAAAVAGSPSITVPMGDSHGLPLGLVFMGRPYAEAQLIGFAYAFESATRARQPPRFLPHLNTD
jgi:amidase